MGAIPLLAVSPLAPSSKGAIPADPSSLVGGGDANILSDGEARRSASGGWGVRVSAPRLLAPKTWVLGSNPLSHPLALSPTKNHLYVGGGGRLETQSHYYGWLPHRACIRIGHASKRLGTQPNYKVPSYPWHII